MRVQVEDLRLQHLLAAEGEQLRRQPARALAGLPDLLEIGRHAPTSLAHLLERELAVAEDDGEQVVEIVGDAAGELADRLHFLRLAGTAPRSRAALPAQGAAR